MICVTVFLCFCVFLGNSSPLIPKINSVRNIGDRIINGENATLGQFPWYAMLVPDYKNGSNSFCGGAIISEEWILTAAYCLDGVDTVFAFVGTVHVESDTKLVTSTEFILHEEYDSSSLANNIAPMRLDETLEFNDIISPVALSSEPLEAGEEITVAGFGAEGSEFVLPSDVLHYITVTTITNNECSEVYGDAILEDMVCTSAGSDPVKGVCLFDTGDPAVINADTDPLLVAIVSFLSGRGCEAGDPSGYTRTSIYRDWIERNTGV